MKKISFPLVLLVCISLFIVAGASVYAYSGGITGKTDGCKGCHGSNPGPGTTVTISGLPGAYEPSETYSLTVTVTSTDVSGNDGGFDLSVTAGTLTVTDSNTQLSSGELIHTSAGSGQRSWSFNWTAPTTGDVTFNVAGLAADGDGSTDGDYWDTYSITISVIPEFPGIALLLVLAAAIIAVIFLARKMIPKVTVEGKSKPSPTFP